MRTLRTENLWEYDVELEEEEVWARFLYSADSAESQDARERMLKSCQEKEYLIVEKDDKTSLHVYNVDALRKTDAITAILIIALRDIAARGAPEDLLSLLEEIGINIIRSSKDLADMLASRSTASNSKMNH